MKLDRRVVALGAVAALTLGMPTAAHAGGGSGKGKAAAAQQQQKAAKAKAEAARKKAAAQKKKADEARAHAAVPGTVTAVGSGTLVVARKQHGTTVSRTLVVASTVVVKLGDAPATLADVRVGDHVVAHVRRVDGALKVVKLNVARRVATPAAPVAPDTATATIVI